MNDSSVTTTSLVGRWRHMTEDRMILLKGEDEGRKRYPSNENIDLSGRKWTEVSQEGEEINYNVRKWFILIYGHPFSWIEYLLGILFFFHFANHSVYYKVSCFKYISKMYDVQYYEILK